MTRTCKMCGLEKPLKGFYQIDDSGNQHTGTCRKCLTQLGEAKRKQRAEEERREVQRLTELLYKFGGGAK